MNAGPKSARKFRSDRSNRAVQREDGSVARHLRKHRASCHAIRLSSLPSRKRNRIAPEPYRTKSSATTNLDLIWWGPGYISLTAKRRLSKSLLAYVGSFERRTNRAGTGGFLASFEGPQTRFINAATGCGSQHRVLCSQRPRYHHAPAHQTGTS